MNTNNEPTLENVNLDFLNKKAIHSFTPFTLLDYPDKSACILWFAGCNMKCDYCYNPEIVFGKGSFYFSEIISLLKSRRNLLDAVVLSGGECLIHKDIIPFIKLVKSLGFLIKVDTNGSQPKVLEKLIEEQLIDYVALAVLERGVVKKGVLELLQQLQSWQIPVALATNSPGSLMNTVLDKLQIRPYFQALCSIELVTQGKPKPEIYHLAASKLGVASEHCLVFEDSVTGLTAAKAAGMKVVALPAEHHWHRAEYDQAESRLKCFSDIQPEHFRAWGFEQR